jgi:hypothetical protein
MKEDFFDKDLGKFVMIRTYSAGVHFGVLDQVAGFKDGHYAVKLVKATRVYSWTGACSLSQLATEGSKKKDSQLSVEIPSIYLAAIEVIPMTPEAVENLKAIPTWKS